MARAALGALPVALPVALLAVALGAQDPMLPVEPAIQVQLKELLDHPDPELRGEAALAAAATSRDQDLHASILALATDKEPAARLRAILALGLLGAPGAEVFLGDLLKKARPHSIERLLAALAMGMLSEATATPALDEFLHQMQGDSIKRHRDALACALLGLASAAHPAKMQGLRDLLEDAAIKDPVVRQLLIQSMATVPSPENGSMFQELLEGAPAEVTIAALQALTDPRYRVEGKPLEQIRRLARRAGNPELRAAALDFLVSRRQTLALELAPKAITSKHRSLIGAGMRAALRLGGGSLREELDNATLSRRDPLQQARMLEVGRGPHRWEFLVKIREIATNKEQPLELRVQATAVVAAAGWKSIVPTLSDLFLMAEDPRHLYTLAVCLESLDVDLTAKIYPVRSLASAARLPGRMRALIAAGNASAVQAVSKSLKDKDVSVETRIELLRAYRLAHQPWPPERLKLAPEAVVTLLE